MGRIASGPAALGIFRPVRSLLIPALERLISRMGCTYTVDIQAKTNNANKGCHTVHT